MNASLIVWLQFAGLLALETALVVGIAAQLQRWRQSAVWRRTVWHVCILSLSLLVIFEFTGTARNWAVQIGNMFRHTGAEQATDTTKILAFKSQGVAAGKMGDGNTEHPTSNAEHRRDDAKVAPQTGPAELLPAQSFAPTGKPDAHAITAPSSPTKLITSSGRAGSDFRALGVALPGLLWLLGIIVVLGRVLFARAAFEVFRWRRHRVNDENLRATLDKLALAMGIRRQIRLLESEQIYGPIAFGLMRPTIALPVGFAQKFNAAQQEAMLAHELAHLAGHDAAWYLLADLSSAVLWWHPLVWKARQQLHAASELAADEASLLVANGPGVLAECLVEIGARLTQRHAFRSMGIEGNGFRSGLGQRVERLVHLDGTWHRPDALRGSLTRALAPMLLVTAMIFCTAWIIPPAFNQGDNMKTIHQTWKHPFTALALLAGLHSTTLSAQQAAPVAPQAVTIATAEATTPSTAPVIAASPAAVATEAAPVPVASVTVTKPGSGGFPFGGGFSGTTQESQSVLHDRLEHSFMDQVSYDGLPLTEVVRQLADKFGKSDPGGPINFVFSRERHDPQPGSVDPATGLPLASVPGFDWSSVVVNINPPLKHVRLLDVLDIITKCTDQPIKYTIEGYGVVFSQDTTKTMNAPLSVSVPEPTEVKAFKAGGNPAFAELQKKYGGNVDENTLQSFLSDFGVDIMDHKYSFHYNRQTGIMMVQGTKHDLAVISAAMESLLGSSSTAAAAESNPLGANRALR